MRICVVGRCYYLDVVFGAKVWFSIGMNEFSLSKLRARYIPVTKDIQVIHVPGLKLIFNSDQR